MRATCKATTENGKPCRKPPVTEDGFCNVHAQRAKGGEPAGRSFEEAVAQVLRVLGYVVKHDVVIPGGQIDLLAELQVGIIRHRLLVECKDYGDRQVGIEEVRSFASLLEDARRLGLTNEGLFVTTRGFSRFAEDYAPKHGVTLTTYHELSTRLVNFNDYLTRLVADWDNSSSALYYTDVTGSVVENYRQALPGELHRPLERLVHHLLFTEQTNHVALLGNFGTGKSTFCRKLAADLARSYDRNNPNSRIPILLNLADYDPRQNIQEFITSTLQFKYQVRLDLALCTELQHQGKFLFILDGFDEMAKQANPFLIRENLQNLDWLTHYPLNKVVLSCRTHFFRDNVQAEMMAEQFAPIYLPEWTERELVEYLQKRFGKQDWERYLHLIQGTHNLTELAQTPLLLDMIASGLPRLQSVQKRADLYRVYTEQWLSKQGKRKGTLLDRRQRTQFVHGLALKLFTEGSPTCHYTDLRPVLRRLISGNDLLLDAIETDVRTCTFLTRDPQGNYEFKHKSFMEFFTAAALAEEGKHGNWESLALRTLPIEIREFLIELLDAPSAIRELAKYVKRAEHPILRDNLLTLLANLGANFTDLTQEHNWEIERDTHLIARVMQGDRSAFDELSGEHWESVNSTITDILGVIDEPLLEHLVMQTLETLFEERARILRVIDFQDSLIRIARRIATAQRRGQSRRPSPGVLRLNDSIEETLPQDVWDSDATGIPPAMKKLHKAVSMLPAESQQVIRARFFQHMNRVEIAAALNLPEKRVTSIIHNAFIELGDLLKAAGLGPGSRMR